MANKGKRDRSHPNSSHPYRWSLIARKPEPEQSAAEKQQSATDKQLAPEPPHSARSQADSLRSSDEASSESVISSPLESEQSEEQQTSRYPLRHLSVRVPWHDDGWRGTVCKYPSLNGACTKITRIGREKSDAVEVAIAGRSFNDLPQEQQPHHCIHENSAFMAPFEINRIQTHSSGARGGFCLLYTSPSPRD